jgi:hypothetical protein
LYSVRFILADVRISADVCYNDTVEFLRDYKAHFDTPDVSVSVSEEDIEAEAARSAEEGVSFSPRYLEALALYRKIANALLDFDVLLMHGSSLAMDGEGFVFTAVSGTGKSTHSRLWRERYGDRVRMINDDKPLVRFIDGTPRIYGTPWDGKHHLNSNTSAPIRAIALLERAAKNKVERIKVMSALPTLLSQVYRPETREGMSKTLVLLERLATSVSLYRLSVNMEPEAAEISYSLMTTDL